MNERDPLRQIIGGLDANEERLASVKRFFASTAAAAAKVEHECELAQDAELILAIDFCEIVDYAYRSAFRRSPEAELRDLAFSWFTIEDLLAPGEGVSLTLLPPTMREILAFLRRSLTYNAWATQLLERTSLDELTAKPSLLIDIQRLLEVPERVATTVLQLAQCSRFRPAPEMDVASGLGDEIAEWVDAIGRIRPRPDRREANRVDAENLATVCAFNRRNAGHSLLQLLTRTESLYRVGGPIGGSRLAVERSVTIDRPLGAGSIEVLLAPRVYALWTILERDSPGTRPVVWRAATAVKSTCRSIEDALGQLVNARRMDLRVPDLVSAMGVIDRELESPAYCHHISRFQHIAQKDADIQIQLEKLGALSSGVLEDDDRQALRERFRQDALASQAIGAREILREAYTAVASIYKDLGGRPAMGFLRRESLGVRSVASGGGAEGLWAERVYRDHPEPGSTTVAVVDRSLLTSGMTIAELRAKALMVITIYGHEGRATIWWRARGTLERLIDTLNTTWAGLALAVVGRDSFGEWFGHVTDETEGLAPGAVLKAATDRVAAVVSWTTKYEEVTWEQAANSHVQVEASFIGVRCQSDAISRWLKLLQRTLPLDVRRATEIAEKHHVPAARVAESV